MATSTINVAVETAVLFGGGTPDVAWTVEGLVDGAGRVSLQYDLGATPRAYEFEWTCKAVWQATATQYNLFELYLAEAPESDITAITGDVGTADAALGDLDQIKNLEILRRPLGQRPLMSCHQG